MHLNVFEQRIPTSNY